MKIRIGFVSNSSSSSFVCDVCGEEYSNWDASISDAEMFNCENGHTVCEKHAVIPIPSSDTLKTKEEVKDYINKNGKRYKESLLAELETIEDDNLEDFVDNMLDQLDLLYEMPESVCPLCNFNDITDGDLLHYLLKTLNMTKEAYLKIIKENYKNYKDFLNFIKK